MHTTTTLRRLRWRFVPLVLGASLALSACGGSSGVAVKDGHVYTASQVAAKCDALFGSPAHVAKELHVGAFSMQGKSNTYYRNEIYCTYAPVGLNVESYGLLAGHKSTQGVAGGNPPTLIYRSGDAWVALEYGYGVKIPDSARSWLRSVVKRVAN